MFKELRVQSAVDYQELLINDQWQLVHSKGRLFHHKDIGPVDNGRALQNVLGPFWNRDIKRMCRDALEHGVSSDTIVEKTQRGVNLTLSFACGPSIEDGRIIGLFLKIRDVTARMRLARHQELRTKMQMISQIVSHVGHKMNNPIATVLNRIGGILVEDNDSFDAAMLRREMQTIQEQLYTMSLITSGLTAFSVGSRKDNKLIQMNSVVENALHLMQFFDSDHKIDFSMSFDPNLPRIIGNEVTLEQSIVNICKNAVEAMPQGGGITITTKVDEQFPDFINITISDNGAGMSPEIQEHAFEPFFTTKSLHHGLGLSVSFAVLSSHGGDIELLDQGEHGTAVQIILPIAKLN